jgi:hypothetical protein
MVDITIPSEWGCSKKSGSQILYINEILNEPEPKNLGSFCSEQDLEGLNFY